MARGVGLQQETLRQEVGGAAYRATGGGPVLQEHQQRPLFAFVWSWFWTSCRTLSSSLISLLLLASPSTAESPLFSIAFFKFNTFLSPWLQSCPLSPTAWFLPPVEMLCTSLIKQLWYIDYAESTNYWPLWILVLLPCNLVISTLWLWAVICFSQQNTTEGTVHGVGAEASGSLVSFPVVSCIIGFLMLTLQPWLENMLEGYER